MMNASVQGQVSRISGCVAGLGYSGWWVGAGAGSAGFRVRHGRARVGRSGRAAGSRRVMWQARFAARAHARSTFQALEGRFRSPMALFVRTLSSTVAWLRCSASSHCGWCEPGMPRIRVIFVATTAYRQPVARSRSVRFFWCRAAGRVRRTIRPVGAWDFVRSAVLSGASPPSITGPAALALSCKIRLEKAHSRLRG
jgi:hypothetical protein